VISGFVQVLHDDRRLPEHEGTVDENRHGGLGVERDDLPMPFAKLRMLAHYSDAVIGPALRDTIFEKRSKGKGAWDQDLLAASERAWRRCLACLESCIAGRMGFSTEFSVADCALLARFGLADHYGVGVDSRHPTLKAWYERMRRRRSFAATEPERPLQVKRKAAI